MKSLLRVAVAALSITSLGVLPSCGTDRINDNLVTTPVPTTSYEALRDDMRKLWSDHVLWTRVLIVDFAAGLPDTRAATDRLLQNQVDLGNAIKPFYGEAAGDAFATLLQAHITIAAELVTAAKAGDAQAVSDANDRWIANADAIALFLAGVNTAWSFQDLQTMMREHLAQTAQEANDRLNGNFTADIADFDAVTVHILGMADVLTDGIAQQFPQKIAPASVASNDETLHLGMRKLWTDHVVWTRMFIISAVAGLPDIEATTARLLQNQDQIGAAVQPFYGDANAAQLSSLLRTHILGAGTLILAAKAGDPAAVDIAYRAWADNANQIADFLASLNGNWDDTALREMMATHLQLTFDEAKARLSGDFAGDINTFDELVNEISSMADTLSAGISDQQSQIS